MCASVSLIAVLFACVFLCLLAFVAVYLCVLLSVSVFIALSTVFHSKNSPDNSSLSHSVHLVLFCLNGPFNCISLHESLPQHFVVDLD